MSRPRWQRNWLLHLCLDDLPWHPNSRMATASVDSAQICKKWCEWMKWIRTGRYLNFSMYFWVFGDHNLEASATSSKLNLAKARLLRYLRVVTVWSRLILSSMAYVDADRSEQEEVHVEFVLCGDRRGFTVRSGFQTPKAESGRIALGVYSIHSRQRLGFLGPHCMLEILAKKIRRLINVTQEILWPAAAHRTAIF